MNVLMRYIFLYAIGLWPWIGLLAQQLPPLTQYTEHLSIINPASLATEYLSYDLKQSAAISYRYQIAQIEDAPQTGYARYDRLIESNSIMAFGGQLTNDLVGPTRQTAVHLRYAYLFNPARHRNFYIGGGFRVGLVQYAVDGQKLQFDAGDPARGSFSSKLILDAHLGFSMAYLPKRGLKWYAGASIPQALGNTIEYDGNDGGAEGPTFNLKRLRHLSLNGGLLIPIGQQGFLEPTLWLRKAAGLPTAVDFNVRQKFDNRFWVGAGYSTANLLHAEAGIILSEQLNMNNAALRIGYGFDYSTAQFSRFFGTSHELNITYMWDKRRQKQGRQ